jgi:hypothetical protein
MNHEQDVFFNHDFDEKLTNFENGLKNLFKNKVSLKSLI